MDFLTQQKVECVILEAASVYKAMQQNRKLSIRKELVCICDFEVI